MRADCDWRPSEAAWGRRQEDTAAAIRGDRDDISETPGETGGPGVGLFTGTSTGGF